VGDEFFFVERGDDDGNFHAEIILQRQRR
jgi:hypothetical protein